MHKASESKDKTVKSNWVSTFTLLEKEYGNPVVTDVRLKALNMSGVSILLLKYLLNQISFDIPCNSIKNLLNY